jgi:uncharacterized Zn-binding protein involved in type VI secretion
MGRPVARIGDLVYFPCCGCRPLVTGDYRFIDKGRPVSRIGDRVSCGARVITGARRFIDKFRPVARIGDLAAVCCCGTSCCTGRIITGDYRFLDGS